MMMTTTTTTTRMEALLARRKMAHQLTLLRGRRKAETAQLRHRKSGCHSVMFQKAVGPAWQPIVHRVGRCNCGRRLMHGAERAPERCKEYGGGHSGCRRAFACHISPVQNRQILSNTIFMKKCSGLECILQVCRFHLVISKKQRAQKLS